jgi:hypothetical protein
VTSTISFELSAEPSAVTADDYAADFVNPPFSRTKLAI